MVSFSSFCGLLCVESHSLECFCFFLINCIPELLSRIKCLNVFSPLSLQVHLHYEWFHADAQFLC